LANTRRDEPSLTAPISWFPTSCSAHWLLGALDQSQRLSRAVEATPVRWRAAELALHELVRLVNQAGVARLAFVDIDSLLRPVYGHAKQGASFGYANRQRETCVQVWVGARHWHTS
jgi:hypothetical protein